MYKSLECLNNQFNMKFALPTKFAIFYLVDKFHFQKFTLYQNWSFRSVSVNRKLTEIRVLNAKGTILKKFNVLLFSSGLVNTASVLVLFEHTLYKSTYISKWLHLSFSIHSHTHMLVCVCACVYIYIYI